MVPHIRRHQGPPGRSDSRREITRERCCPHIRIGNKVVRTASVMGQFGAPLDITLDELRIDTPI
jgi:hypothetical protein